MEPSMIAEGHIGSKRCLVWPLLFCLWHIGVTWWVAPFLARLLATGIWKTLLPSHLELLSHSTSVYSKFYFLYLRWICFLTCRKFGLGIERRYSVVVLNTLNWATCFHSATVTDSVIKDLFFLNFINIIGVTLCNAQVYSSIIRHLYIALRILFTDPSGLES